MEETTIKIDGCDIAIHPLTFKDLCTLDEKYGFSVTNASEHVMLVYPKLLAFFKGISVDEAEDMIDRHLANGGYSEDLNPFLDCINKSGFFRQKPKAEVNSETAQAETTTADVNASAAQ